jgi:F-type H+-transporting ATPase subunit d
MVDDFQKKYESLQVPYPKDTMTSLIENQAVEHKSAYEKFVKESKSRYN